MVLKKINDPVFGDVTQILEKSSDKVYILKEVSFNSEDELNRVKRDLEKKQGD